VWPDGVEERETLPADLWESLNTQNFPEETSEEKGFDVPSLSADVSELNFYESGQDGIPYDQREYKTRFSKSATRCINWELNLEFPDPGRRIDFEITAVWYNPDGSVLNRQQKPSRIETGWTDSQHYIGWGWREPGNWDPGIYRIELFIEGQKVAGGSFEIVR
jgi:hypothetical protein